jgi:hypothetical protein
MAKKEIKLVKEVKLFSDQDTLVNQSVIIDMNDELEPWCVISHNGDEISMSLKNLKSLIELVEIAKSRL